MGIWAELGIFALALAFGLWQLWDVRKAREQTRRQRGEQNSTQRSKGTPDTDKDTHRP